MIRFLEHDEIEQGRWDHCISNALNGNVYGFSWYLNRVCPGWCALADETYSRIMPLPAWEKAGIRYLSQPYFTQQLGLYSLSAIDEITLSAFLSMIPGRFRFFDINLNSSNNFEVPGINSLPQTNYELYLSEDYASLRKGYSENLLRNLRKSKKEPLIIDRNASPEHLIELFRQNRGATLTLGDSQYDLLSALLHDCLERKTGELWGVVDNLDQLYAGAAWVFSHGKVIFLFSAVSAAGKEKAAMPFLIDSLISEKSGSKLVLDFEGSNNATLARFYAGFGSQRLNYPRISGNSLPLPLRTALKIVRFLRDGGKK